jgi:hypothetical protein
MELNLVCAGDTRLSRQGRGRRRDGLTGGPQDTEADREIPENFPSLAQRCHNPATQEEGEGGKSLCWDSYTRALFVRTGLGEACLFRDICAAAVGEIARGIYGSL